MGKKRRMCTERKDSLISVSPTINTRRVIRDVIKILVWLVLVSCSVLLLLVFSDIDTQAHLQPLQNIIVSFALRDSFSAFFVTFICQNYLNSCSLTQKF